MTISYTSLLGLAQPVTGTETGQWGTVVNDEITALLEDAVANSASISVTAGNVTLSATNGSSNQARMSTLIITGTPGTTRNVVAPSQAKIYVVINQSDGAVVIKGAATSGVTIGAGQTAQVAWNGSDFVEIGNYVHGNFVVNGNLSVNGDSTLGNAGADTTTINGQVIAANSNISKTTTLSASAPALAWIKGATYTDTGTAGGTTQALAPFTVFSAPTLSTSNIVTYTNAATVYVAGAPAAAGSATITNPYALYVAAGDAYFGASVSATTLDLTNLEVTNIKAKDGTASITLADSTGQATFSANPVLNAGTANGVPYLNASKVLTTGSALTFDGTNLGLGTASPSGASGTTFAINGGAGQTRLALKNNNSGDASNDGFQIALLADGINVVYQNRESGYQAWELAGSEQMRLTSTGLGIGTTSSFSGAKLVTDGGGIGILNKGLLRSSTNGVLQVSADPSNAYASSQISFDVDGATVATLDSSGNLGLGVTPSASWSSMRALQNGTATFANDTGAPRGRLITNAVYNGSNYLFLDASSNYALNYTQDGATGVHQWRTSTAAGTSPNTATLSDLMTLLANGNLGIGETNPSEALEIKRDGATTASIVVNQIGTGGRKYIIGSTGSGYGSAGNLIFYDATASAERARITSGGEFLLSGLNSSVGSYWLQIKNTNSSANGAYMENASGNDRGILVMKHDQAAGATTGAMLVFQNSSGSTVGSITASNTATAYNISSDRRLKENIALADDAGSLIDNIEVVKFDWKVGGHTRYGVVAQDLHAVAPEAVAQGDNGDEIERTWGVDYSKLIPLLIKEIQSLRARVAALEA